MNRLFFLIMLGFLPCFSFATDFDSELGYKEAEGQVFGYNTVLEALEALKKDPNSKVNYSQGWIIVTDNTNKVLWSFVTQEHPSYPSVVRRAVVEEDNQIRIITEIRCSSTRAICDSLVNDFIILNQKILKQ